MQKRITDIDGKAVFQNAENRTHKTKFKVGEIETPEVELKVSGTTQVDVQINIVGVFRYDFKPDTGYSPLDVVLANDGAQYIAAIANSGDKQPYADKANWNIFLPKGKAGKDGENGNNGSNGKNMKCVGKWIKGVRYYECQIVYLQVSPANIIYFSAINDNQSLTSPELDKTNWVEAGSLQGGGGGMNTMCLKFPIKKQNGVRMKSEQVKACYYVPALMVDYEGLDIWEAEHFGNGSHFGFMENDTNVTITRDDKESGFEEVMVKLVILFTGTPEAEPEKLFHLEPISDEEFQSIAAKRQKINK